MKKGFLSEADYNFIYSRAPRLCVDLLIKRKQGVLLSRRLIEPYKNSWHLPGGRVYFQESLGRAVQRVARAEIGSGVRIQKLAGYIEFIREVQGKKLRHSVSLAFLASPLKVGLQGSWQGQDLKFFKALPKNIHPIHGKFLKINKYLK